jgi:hypothetical protein
MATAKNNISDSGVEDKDSLEGKNIGKSLGTGGIFTI